MVYHATRARRISSKAKKKTTSRISLLELVSWLKTLKVVTLAFAAIAGLWLFLAGLYFEFVVLFLNSHILTRFWSIVGYDTDLIAGSFSSSWAFRSRISVWRQSTESVVE